MPQTKKQLLDEVKKLGLKVDPTTKMADLRQLIADNSSDKHQAEAAEPKVETPEESAPAKAGKRSAKAIREIEEESAKNDQNTSKADKASAQKPPRTKLERKAKTYRKLAEKIEVGKSYTLVEAIKLVRTTSPAKFDASVELHVNLSVDPRQSEQNVRDSVLLPAGSGQKLIVAALTDDPEEAKKAGADIAGSDDLLATIDKGQLNFDILIATPGLMPKLGKYARVLGPKGLMPNPKSGTVTTDVKKAVSEAKAGKVEYRVDSTGIVHLAIGKVSFDSNGLKDNIVAVIQSIRSNKPSNVKSNYVKSVYLTTTMGPSVNVDLPSLNETSA